MFNILNDDKTLVLIDGANMYATTKALGFDVDFASFYKEIERSCNLMRINYYTALIEDGEKTPLKPLVDWLAYNRYTVITKPAKIMFNNEGVRKVKGNMDIEFALGAVEMVVNAVSPLAGNIVFCTGDGDFCPLIRFLQSRGVTITVLSSIKTQPAMCADDLRKQADNFVDLVDIRELIEKRRLSPVPYKETVYTPPKEVVEEDDYERDASADVVQT